MLCPELHYTYLLIKSFAAALLWLEKAATTHPGSEIIVSWAQVGGSELAHVHMNSLNRSDRRTPRNPEAKAPAPRMVKPRSRGNRSSSDLNVEVESDMLAARKCLPVYWKVGDEGGFQV